MSETFYIKKTAFDDNNFDLTQREADSFIIGPGELNGPGGLAQDSDLELYGFGAIKWGEGVNQNQYRMLESNACPEKVAGDFLVGTDDPDGYVPGTGSFVPNAGSPVNGAVPKDMYDLGLGNGITEPLIGQLWYNTSQSVLYNNEPAGWTTVFHEATNNLTDHINDGTVHLRDGQNTFLDGLILGGSPLSLQSHDVNQLIGITDVDGTVQDQINLMVDTRGDTMTGNLILNSLVDLQLEGGVHRITNNDGGGDFNVRIGHEFSGSEIYTGTNQGAIHLLGAHEGELPNFSIKLGDTFTTTIGNPVAYNGTFEFGNDGNLSVSAATPSAVGDLTRKDYVDLKADINSPTFTGAPNAPTPTTNDDSTHIATTAWVKNQSIEVGSVITSGSSSSATVPAGVTRADVTIIGAGGGGASGGDGGNTNGGDGGTGGNSAFHTPSTGWITVYGGLGGRGFVGSYSAPLTNHAWYRHPRGYGWGSENVGNIGGPALGNGPATRGGDGGASPLGYAGAGSAAFGTWGGTGFLGGGGGGGPGQDNLCGEGGHSGKCLTSYVASVSAGQTLTWTIGAAGARGTFANSDRYGGKGGGGWIIIRWLTN